MGWKIHMGKASFTAHWCTRDQTIYYWAKLEPAMIQTMKTLDGVSTFEILNQFMNLAFQQALANCWRGQITDPQWKHMFSSTNAINRSLFGEEPPVLKYHDERPSWDDPDPFIAKYERRRRKGKPGPKTPGLEVQLEIVKSFRRSGLSQQGYCELQGWKSRTPLRRAMEALENFPLDSEII